MQKDRQIDRMQKDRDRMQKDREIDIERCGEKYIRFCSDTEHNRESAAFIDY